MGRTPPPGLRSAVTFDRAKAAAALSGKSCVATRKSTSCRAVSAVGEVSAQRQCSQRPPPRAAPLPRGVLRSARFVSLRGKGAGPPPARGRGGSGGTAYGPSKSWSSAAVSSVSGARPGLARRAAAREYSSARAFRRRGSFRRGAWGRPFRGCARCSLLRFPRPRGAQPSCLEGARLPVRAPSVRGPSARPLYDLGGRQRAGVARRRGGAHGEARVSKPVLPASSPRAL